MNLSFDTGAVIEGYRSKTQLARILTETWVARNMYCPRCGHTHITHFENNRPVAGFFCPAWTMDILACLNRVAAQKFTPEDIYDTSANCKPSTHKTTTSDRKSVSNCNSCAI